MDIIRVPEQVGTVLRAARVQQGMTQAEVAEKIGVSPQAMSRLEKNAGRASFDRIHRLCLLLGLEVVLRPRGHPGTQKNLRYEEW
ncbi:helix-turn-helix transcriptional regulator [Oleiagrimonas sp.]|jgi:HTH-type transcriptional regulator/antitoxin HipB|uniref:helix-turn-helix domain-containing protein n=1 Tax=Oleiagrimonas sp. TaxID=2010330 RepID=UPI0026031560|nr:helix-turn-helix transcriptional regulator [Oleiagrimonas sp.]MDA3915290.1 helix-turn-helix transcriptional regulator [Oleiagrimonas sp.]